MNQWKLRRNFRHCTQQKIRDQNIKGLLDERPLAREDLTYVV